MQESEGRFLSKGNRNVSFSEDRIVIDGVPVISRDENQFVVDLPESLDRLDHNSDFAARLEKVARLLNEGRQFEAIFMATTGHWDRNHLALSEIHKANFDPNQPRDLQGQWTTGSSDFDGGLPVEDVQYRGFFHDVVVDDLLKGLTAGGSTVLKNIKVLGLNGVLAIPDGASRPHEANKPYFIEVKTGDDPDFTPNQKQVYPLICIGGHATSSDSRITQLGLTPGVPFPPLDILLVHTSGPGMPMRYESYCVEFGFWATPDGP